jgi:hypothetical protein
MGIVLNLPKYLTDTCEYVTMGRKLNKFHLEGYDFVQAIPKKDNTFILVFKLREPNGSDSKAST